MPIVDAYTLVGAWPQAEVDLSVEALAAGMQSRGVGGSLVTHTSAIFYNCASGNDQIVQLCSRHAPLTPVAVVNPLEFPAALEEIARRLEQGVRVFRFCPRQHGYPFSGSVGPLRGVLPALMAARLLLVDLSDLPAPVLSADMAALLPCPTAVTVDSAGLGTAIECGKQTERLCVETSRLEAGGAIEAAVKHLGAERVLFGSGAPLRSLGSAVMSLQYAELSDSDRTAVFEGNVRRLIG